MTIIEAFAVLTLVIGLGLAIVALMVIGAEHI